MSPSTTFAPNWLNKTIASAAGAVLTAIAALPFATTAQASTSGCALAKFTCGTFVQYAANGNNVARPGWAASAGKAGAPVLMEPDRATSAATDFRVIRRDRDVRVEYAPHGHETHLYVGVSTATYETGGREVRPGSLILMGWNGAWQERWTEVPDHGGVALQNDYSGLYVLPVGSGQQVKTGAPRHWSTAAWRFNGNGGN